MELKSIQFGRGSAGATPEAITVEMSVPEAIAIVLLFGGMNKESYDKVGMDISDPERPYMVLQNDVFNRYWESGVAEFGMSIGYVHVMEPEE